MKKNMAAVLGCFMLLSTVAHETLAVWPPSTSFQEEANPPARQDLSLSDRIEQDIRRLEEALKDLKEDQQELKKTQEEKDGLRLH